MLCPFKLIIRQGKDYYYEPGENAVNNRHLRFIECEKEDCAWWIDKSNWCAIKDIAESLTIMMDYKSKLNQVLSPLLRSNEELEANKRLIAAAPELYEALREVYRLLENYVPTWYTQKYYRLMTSALNKAGGGIGL